MGVDDAALRKHFEYYGPVEEASVVTNPNTGKSKCFGFVEFKDAETREKVLADGSNQEISGKSVEVKPKTAKGGSKGAGKAAGKGKDGGKNGKGKDGKGKDGKGKKGGKDKGAAKNGKAPQVRKMDAEDDDDDDDDEESDDEEEDAAPAPKKKAAANKKQAAADEDEGLVMTEEMKQMMALGLPVSFTASEQLGGTSDDEEDEDE